MPPSIEIEIISRLFGSTPQIVCISLGLIVGAATMAVQTGEPVFYGLTLAGIATSALRLAHIAAFARRSADVPLTLAEARRWEKGYACAAFAFTVVLAGLTVATCRLEGHHGGHVLSIGLVMAQTAGSYLRTLRFWICATLSTLSIGTLAVAFLFSGDALYQALGILLLLYLISIYESSDHLIGQFEELLIARRELDHAARHDQLTGLLNRRGIDFILAESWASGEPLCLLMLDLDGFKLVNDRLGHAAGDELLRQVGRRLNDIVRSQDSIGRIGGDEFAIVLRGGCDIGFANAIAARVVSALSEPFEIIGQRAQIGTSVGIAALNRDGAEPDDSVAVLMVKADGALYEAKRAGRGRYHRASALYSV